MAGPGRGNKRRGVFCWGAQGGQKCRACKVAIGAGRAKPSKRQVRNGFRWRGDDGATSGGELLQVEFPKRCLGVVGVGNMGWLYHCQRVAGGGWRVAGGGAGWLRSILRIRSRGCCVEWTRGRPRDLTSGQSGAARKTSENGLRASGKCVNMGLSWPMSQIAEMIKI